MVSNPQGANLLEKLDEASCLLTRKRYWKQIRARGNVSSDSPVVFDTMWITAEALPTIYRLFPQAHVIILNRDPGSMLMSWARQGFTDLESLADMYSEQQRLLTLCRESIPLQYLEIDYEALQADPEAIFTDLLSGFGLENTTEVNAAFSRFHGHELGAAEDWQHYARWMSGPLARLGLDA